MAERIKRIPAWGPCPSPTPRLACPFYLFIGLSGLCFFLFALRARRYLGGSSGVRCVLPTRGNYRLFSHSGAHTGLNLTRLASTSSHHFSNKDCCTRSSLLSLRVRHGRSAQTSDEELRESPALGALGVQSLTAHPGPGSSEAHPAGRMIGIGLRAREP